MNARQCINRDGSPKIAYANFDDAHEAAVNTMARTKQTYRVHAYRCEIHGWHVGSNLYPAAIRQSA